MQAHKEFFRGLHLNNESILTSFVAAKLNGYLAGIGGIKQFEKEVPEFGLSQRQIQYVRKYIIENEGAGLSC